MEEKSIKVYKAIGYWHSEEQPNMPDPALFIDENWDITEKQAVIDYLKKGERLADYRGWSWCRFGCAGAYGTADMTDGTYVFPEGLVHYIEKHHVRLPLDFVNHIYGKSAKAPPILTKVLNYFTKKNIVKGQFNDIDYDWWLSQNKNNPHNLSHKNGSKTVEKSFKSQKEAMNFAEKNVGTSIEFTLLDKSIIRELISNGNTEKALLQLQLAGYPEATIAYQKYKEKARLMHIGMLNTADWYALQKQLYEDILSWEYLEDTRPQRLFTNSAKLHIKELLNTQQTAEAINLCKDVDDKSAIISGYYTRIIKGKELGLLTESEQEVYFAEINEAVVAWLC
jgi:hypothetical protein